MPLISPVNLRRRLDDGSGSAEPPHLPHKLGAIELMIVFGTMPSHYGPN